MQVVVHLGFERAGDTPLGLLDVGGIRLIQRTLRSARHAGATRALILSAHPERYAASLDRDDTDGLAISWHDTRLSVDEDLWALAEVDELLEDTFWYVRGDRILTPGVLRGLEEPGDSAAVIVDAEERAIAWSMRADWLRAQPQGRHTDTLIAVSDVSLTRNEQKELVCVRTFTDARTARDLLFSTLRKPFGRQGDGLTAYYINRPVSLFISRRLIHTPARPNQVTTFDLFLGLVAAALIATGRWELMFVGGFLMQLVSIFDGIDGELARMKLLMSLQGQWYDSVTDDIIKLSMFLSLGAAAYIANPDPIFIHLSIVGALFVMTTVGLMYVDLVKAGVGTLNHHKWAFEEEGTSIRGPLKALLTGISYIAKRDTYTLIFALLTMANLPHIAFFIMFAGIAAIFFGWIGQKALAVFRSGGDLDA